MAKRPISATIDEELIKWIDLKLKDRAKYRNKSHLIEVALESLKDEGKEQKR
ncbi:MAG: hypothetical protein KAU20_03715 [Nanoarchaeota archaeon]|nr:hypothetical protein [Nanoarchaeota archaeon]